MPRSTKAILQQRIDAVYDLLLQGVARRGILTYAAKQGWGVVMVGGLEASGLLERIAQSPAVLKDVNPVIVGIAVIWTVGLLSAAIDNIPVTIALIPVIFGLRAEGVDVEALWWALAFGAGLGGNGTIIGASANVMVASLSERTQHPITSAYWTRRGLPVMLVTLVVASLLYVPAYYVLYAP